MHSHLLSPLILSAILLSALVGSVHAFFTPIKNRQHPRSLLARDNRTFTLTDMYQGKSFFDGWDFFSAPDPTHGRVQFLNESDAFSQGLAYVQDDNTTVLAVDDFSTVPVGGNRNSVRISTKKQYNGGLFIADFWAMPHGCSVWPAWWSVGPNWPAGGEIDILEGVNNQSTNQYTLHTSGGCTLQDPAAATPPAGNQTFTAAVIGTTCESSGANNDGCAFLDADPRTFGHGFNMLAGGVYAHLWDATGIRVWRFTRATIPADVTAGTPDPTTWGTPAAFWANTGCDVNTHFSDHVLTLDTTICGDWAEGVYASSGCPGTCAEAVADPKNFAFAKWKINYIAVYN